MNDSVDYLLCFIKNFESPNILETEIYQASQHLNILFNFICRNRTSQNAILEKFGVEDFIKLLNNSIYFYIVKFKNHKTWPSNPELYSFKIIIVLTKILRTLCAFSESHQSTILDYQFLVNAAIFLQKIMYYYKSTLMFKKNYSVIPFLDCIFHLLQVLGNACVNNELNKSLLWDCLLFFPEKSSVILTSDLPFIFIKFFNYLYYKVKDIDMDLIKEISRFNLLTCILDFLYFILAEADNSLGANDCNNNHSGFITNKKCIYTKVINIRSLCDPEIYGYKNKIVGVIFMIIYNCILTDNKKLKSLVSSLCKGAPDSVNNNKGIDNTNNIESTLLCLHMVMILKEDFLLKDGSYTETEEGLEWLRFIFDTIVRTENLVNLYTLLEGAPQLLGVKLEKLNLVQLYMDPSVCTERNTVNTTLWKVRVGGLVLDVFCRIIEEGFNIKILLRELTINSELVSRNDIYISMSTIDFLARKFKEFTREFQYISTKILVLGERAIEELSLEVLRLELLELSILFILKILSNFLIKRCYFIIYSYFYKTLI
jgi:hypothetical protein